MSRDRETRPHWPPVASDVAASTTAPAAGPAHRTGPSRRPIAPAAPLAAARRERGTSTAILREAFPPQSARWPRGAAPGE